MYLLIILFFTVSSLLYSQQVSNWQNYTDMKNVKSLMTNGSLIWGASDGGVFSYNIDNSSYNKYSKIDGLNGVSITAVTVDKYGKVWFGSSNGIIDVYDPQTKSFRTLLDIFNTDKSSKIINELTAIGDTIFVSSDFGISLINASNHLFIDTFSKFGELPSNIGVNSVFISGLIYASTDMGVAIQKTGATNLSAPESWNVYRTSNGLPSDSVTKIGFFNGSIIAATSKGLASFNDSIWTPFIVELNTLLINDIIVAGDSLFIISGAQNISKYHNGLLTPVYSSSERNIFKLNYSPTQGILAATSKGIYKISDGTYLYPNGPFANKFPDITVDNKGILWSASGSDVSAVGFYSYDGNNWTNYNTSTTPELTSNTYFRVFSASNNKLIFGNWGQGIAVYNNGEIRTYKENLGMLGTQNDPDYIVITGIAEDSKNNIWLLNYGAADRKNLSRSADLENWTSYSIPSIGNSYVDESFNLVIDQNDTKWFAVQRHKQGLFYFNEGGNSDPGNTADDVSGYLNESSGLNDDFVTSIAIDRRGDIWIGTSLGVNIISNVGSVLSGNPQLRISSVFSLRQQTITAILVDPLNQKWIGTKQGLHLVNSDGTGLLATFNSINSALLSDEITSLEIDENSGTIYVGTNNRGLTSFKTTSVKPNESFDGLFAYPNPFILNNQNNLITIDGLIRDTDIKILTINGKLVKQFTTPGGRVALWDGRDDFGDLIPSGVYFIVAFDQEGNNVAKTKIAVLRED